MINFDVSALDESENNALRRYEVRFSVPVNADWLIRVIKTALEQSGLTRHQPDAAGEREQLELNEDQC